MIGRLLHWVRRSRAVHDFAWITAANVLVKPAWFLFVTAACMRTFGAAGYGVFISAIALGALVVALTEWGVSEYVMREVSRDSERAASLFSNLVVARIVLGLGAVGAAAVGARWLGFEGASWAAVGAAGLYALGLRVNELARGFYRASDAFAQDAVLTLSERALTITGGVIALVLWGTPVAVLAGLAVSIAAVVAGNLVWIAWRHGVLSLRHLSGAVVRVAYAAAYPIGVYSLCAIAYHSAGPILLASLASETAAGHYGAAWRVVELYMLAPSLLTSVVMPRLASLAVADGLPTGEQPAFRRLVGRSGALLLGATGIIALVTALLAEPLVGLLAGEADFQETVGLLRWLAAGFPLMSLSMLLSLSLVACDRQWSAALTTGLAGALHIGLIWVWIPTAGAQGVAEAMVLSYAVAVALGVWALFRRERRPARPGADDVLESGQPVAPTGGRAPFGAEVA